MRIAIFNANSRSLGGVERYVEEVIAELVDRGHAIVLVSESDAPSDRESIHLPAGVAALHATAEDLGASLDGLRTWGPDVVFAQSMAHPELLTAFREVAPVVFYVHTYTGTCVSGSKTFSFPTARPCVRRFGVGCLALYHARRCGGLDPITMLRSFRRQEERLQELHLADAVIANSDHMADECRAHGVEAEAIYPFVSGASSSADSSSGRELPVRRERRLLAVGRLDHLKGGHLLLESLPRVRSALGRPLHVTFAGDGPQRPEWERRAKILEAADPDISITFSGWVDATRRDELYRDADLLVVPSVWPEPFGLVGVEAAAMGLPAAAFAVGGIPEWLADRANGRLALGATPSSEALADAVVACLEDPGTYANLSRGALAAATAYSRASHLDALLRVFARVLPTSGSPATETAEARS